MTPRGSPASPCSRSKACALRPAAAITRSNRRSEPSSATVSGRSESSGVAATSWSTHLPADTAGAEEAEQAAKTAQRLITAAGTLLPQLSFFSQDQQLWVCSLSPPVPDSIHSRPSSLVMTYRQQLAQGQRGPRCCASRYGHARQAVYPHCRSSPPLVEALAFLAGDRQYVEVAVADSALEGADDRARIVVEPEDVKRLAVLAERDGIRARP